MNNGGCRGSPIAIMKFAGKPGLVGRHGLSTQKHLARFRNRGRAFRLSAWQANPPSFVASSHFGSSGLFDQVRGSVVRFCSFILLFFFLFFLLDDMSQFPRNVPSTVRKYIHTYIYTFARIYFLLSRSKEDILDSRCRIVVKMESWFIGSNITRMIIIRGYSGGYSLVNGIYSGKLAGIILAYPSISKIREYSGKCVGLWAWQMIMIGPIVCSIRSIIGEIRLSWSIFGEEQQRTNPFSSLFLSRSGE